MLLSACGGGVSNPVPTSLPTDLTYTIGGTVLGLTSSGLALQNNGGDALNITADGAFSFATAINHGSERLFWLRARSKRRQ